MARLSPLGFDHINMLGRYAFILPDGIARGELRPLRDPAATSHDEDGIAVSVPLLPEPLKHDRSIAYSADRRPDPTPIHSRSRLTPGSDASSV